MKEIKDIKFKYKYSLEEKKEILKMCGFEEIDVVLENFKKENKLKYDILISEIIHEKIVRNRNTILVYLENGEVINRYSKEYLQENSIDKIILRLKDFLRMQNKFRNKNIEQKNEMETTNYSPSKHKLTPEFIEEVAKEVTNKMKEYSFIFKELPTEINIELDSEVISKFSNKCEDEFNIEKILKEGHEIDNFKEYLKREEKELENIIFGIESKGNKATIGEQSMQYEAQETIEIIRQLKQKIKNFKESKREIKKHIGR